MVVSRRDPALYDHLARALAGTAGIEVVLDRRQGERRKGGAQPDDHRRGDRRIHPAPRFPALGSEVVRAGVERVNGERPTYRTLLWPTVRLADLFPKR